MGKQTTLLITCIVLLTTFAGAQENDADMWFLGGISNSRLFSDSLPTRPMSSFMLGIGARWELKQPFYAGASSSFVRRGFESDDQNARLINDYLDLGVSAEAEVLPGLFIGPRIHYANLLYSRLRSQSVFTNYERRNQSNTGYRSSFHVGLTARVELQAGLEFGMNLSAPRFLEHGMLSEFYVAVNPQVSRGESEAHRDRREAYRHIMAMRESILLVRLHTLQPTIDALRESGKNQEADEVEFKIKIQSERIIRAFNDRFDFCPVYFFYSHDSPAIRAGQFEEVLYDGPELPTQAQISDSVSYYIADFGILEPDTATYFLGYDLVSDGNFSVKRIRREYRPTTFRFGALKVRDSEFNQLRSPFPFWVKTYGPYLFKRDVDAIVERFSEKLYEFHNKAKANHRIKKD